MKAVIALRRLLFLADLLACLPTTQIYAGCLNPTSNEKDIISTMITTRTNFAIDYFKGDYLYWTGYRNPRSDSSWFDIPTGRGYQCKTTNPWDTEIGGAKGVYGHSTPTNRDR
jgi:hypothetical protein